MTEDLSIESIRRLEVNPGDTLVITLKDVGWHEEFEDVWRKLQDSFPDGVKVVVTTNNVDFTAITRGACTCGAKP